MNKENLKEIVFQAIGQASMCWVEIPTSVFDSERARKVADELLESILKEFN